MNENKILILAVLIICFSFVCQEINITGHTIYYHGDSFESGGKTVKIIRISKSNAVFEVNGVKNIVSIGDHKNINGVDIKLINIFYVDEEEARNVDISVEALEAGSCGDGECKAGETSGSCCLDCGCPTDYRCEDNECVYSKPAECKEHEDCDDNNPDTIDLCLNTNPKRCGNYLEGEEETAEEEITEDEEVIYTSEIEEGKQSFFDRVISFFKSIF